jgi:hypothetical protein
MTVFQTPLKLSLALYLDCVPLSLAWNGVSVLLEVRELEVEELEVEQLEVEKLEVEELGVED